jgi:DNA-binding transcriptional LysR family regulator
MDLNQLVDLDALLREGSVTGAAQRLHISAPAMSRRLARLREALGDPLFVLAGRRLEPTQRAIELASRVHALIDDVRGLLAPPVADLGRVSRTLSLRVNDGFLSGWAARLIERVGREAPGVTLRFMPRADKNMEALRRGEVDLDLGVLDAPVPEIHTRSLLKTRFVAVVRRDHPLARRRRLSPADLAQWPHVSASRRGRMCGPIDGAMKSLGLRRSVAVVVPGFQSALQMAASSDLIAAVPQAIVRWHVPAEGLKAFELPFETPEVEVSMSWHPRQHADAVHRWLREQVLATTVAQAPRR